MSYDDDTHYHAARQKIEYANVQSLAEQAELREKLDPKRLALDLILEAMGAGDPLKVKIAQEACKRLMSKQEAKVLDILEESAEAKPESIAA